MKRRLRRKNAGKRRGAAGAVLCVAGLLLALGCLERIGPPPGVRVDALWVNEHRVEVRVCLLGLACAVVGMLITIGIKRYRWVSVCSWIAAGAAGAAIFSDRAWIIARVVIEHGR